MMHINVISEISVLFSQIGVLYLLTACSPTCVAPPSSLSSSPHIAEHIFISFDNTELPLRVWLPANEVNGVIIAVHGFNDYSNFIKDSASFFNKRKFAIYSYDQRGFGKTITRGRWSGWQAMTDDLTSFITLIKQVHPDTPVYILGDSMGGAVTIVSMTQRTSPDVQGVILVAPAVWARSEMPFYQRFVLWIAAHTIPWKKVTGQSLGITASDNIEMLRMLGKDPLVIKETRIEVLYGLSNLMDKAFKSAERFRVMSLILYGEKDEIIPREPVFDFYKRLPLKSQDQQRMILYENGYHMLLRDLQSEKVLKEIVDWINDQT
jgi:alpha-beta hydrolase superfamily lysophospholipase